MISQFSNQFCFFFRIQTLNVSSISTAIYTLRVIMKTKKQKLQMFQITASRRDGLYS